MEYSSVWHIKPDYDSVLAMHNYTNSTITSSQQPVELREVFSELHGVQAKWWNIGLQLKVPNATLHAIQNDPKLEKDEARLREMLDGRIKQGVLTWDEIVEALEDVTVNEKGLAEDIRNRWIDPQSSMSEFIRYFIPTRETLKSLFFPKML